MRSVDLDDVERGGDGAPGRLAERGHERVDLVDVEGTWHVASGQGGARHRRRRHRLGPGDRRGGLAPGELQLGADERAVAVTRVREPPVSGHQLVVVDAELVPVVLPGRVHVHRLEHDERGAPGRPRLAVVHVPLGHGARRQREVLLHGRHEDTVPERHPADAAAREEARVAGHPSRAGATGGMSPGGEATTRNTRSSRPVLKIPCRTPGGMCTTMWGSIRCRTPSSSTMPLPYGEPVFGKRRLGPDQ